MLLLVRQGLHVRRAEEGIELLADACEPDLRRTQIVQRSAITGRTESIVEAIGESIQVPGNQRSLKLELPGERIGGRRPGQCGRIRLRQRCVSRLRQRRTSGRAVPDLAAKLRGRGARIAKEPRIIAEAANRLAARSQVGQAIGPAGSVSGYLRHYRQAWTLAGRCARL